MASIPTSFYDTRKLNLRDEHGLQAFVDETPRLVNLQHSFRAVFGTAVMAVPMPPVDGPTVLFLDLSKWNWPIDLSVAKAKGIKAIWIKQGQGIWPDSQFEALIKEAERVGIEIGFYHFIDPTQTTVTAVKAATLAADMTKGVGRLSMWIDAERNGNLTPSQMLRYLIDWYGTYFTLTGRMIEMYTRLSWFNPMVARSNFWRENKVRLNAARYHIGLTSPWSDGKYAPLDWNLAGDEFEEWQYSADGNGLGSYFGSNGAISIDLNLFKGTWEDFEIVYKLKDVVPPPDHGCCDELAQLKVRVDNLEADINSIRTDVKAVTTQVTAQYTSIEENTRKIAVQAIQAHSHDSSPPVVPPPDAGSILVRVHEGKKTPAFSYKDKNVSGAPKMIYNVYQETGDKSLLWESSAIIRVSPEVVTADGGIKWYKIIEPVSHYGYPALYVRKDRVGIV